MALVKPPGLGSKFSDREAGSVVDVDGSIGNLAGDVRQVNESVVLNKTVIQVGHGNVGPRAEQSLHQLFRAHFKAENGAWNPLIDSHVFDNVHDQRGFAHGRAGRDNDHF